MRVKPVLLLTDHPDDGAMYVTGLARHGFRVSVADEFEDLATTIRCAEPDAVVLDMKLGISNCGRASRRSAAAITSTCQESCSRARFGRIEPTASARGTSAARRS